MELPKEPAEGEPLSYVWGVQVVRCLRAIWPCSSATCKVDTTGNGSTFTPRGSAGTAAGASFPWDQLCLGFSIAGAVVTIKAGDVQWGTVALVIAETPVTIAYDLTYVGVWATTTAAGVLAPSTDVSTMRSDADTFRCWLYQFKLSSTGAVSLNRIGHMGNIMIPAMGAPP